MNGDFFGPINGIIIRTDFSRVISSLSFWGLLYLRVGFNPLKNIGWSGMEKDQANEAPPGCKSL